MKKFLKKYINPNEQRINFNLMERLYDGELIDYLINSAKSLEVLSNIQYIGHEFITDESKIDMNNYMSTRNKSKKKTDIKYMYMQDSRYGELRLKFLLKCKGEQATIVKKILVPMPDMNGYFTIKGKKYFLLYQLVDASTYTYRDNLILKSLMPVAIKRGQKEFKDTKGNVHIGPIYNIFIFKKEVDVLLFYFAKIGARKTLKYFSVNSILDFVDAEHDSENNYYFTISSKLLLEVNKTFFDKYHYVKSIVAMILNICSNRINFDNLENTRYWIEKIGSLHGTTTYNYYEKGLNTMIFFDRMMDETTKEILKVHGENRKNIYSVVRWMIQDFNELRKKDNLDLDNKRLRGNEYIAALLTKAFSDRINRIISIGNKKLTLDKVKEIFKFSGDILIQQLYKSGLLRYDDKINDMDFYSKFKYTLKGPNSMGGKNENTVSMKYRNIHPSYIGRIDINVCGNSDPGTSGVLTPYCNTNGLYFSDKNEPENFKFDLEHSISEHLKNNSDKMVLDLGIDNITDYFKMQERSIELNRGITIKEIEKENAFKYYIKVNVTDDTDI